MFCYLTIHANEQTTETKSDMITLSMTTIIQLVIYIIGIVGFVMALKFNTKANNERLDKHEFKLSEHDFRFDKLNSSIDEKFKAFLDSIEKKINNDICTNTRDLQGKIEMAKTISEQKIELVSQKMIIQNQNIEATLTQIQRDQAEIFDKINELAIAFAKHGNN